MKRSLAPKEHGAYAQLGLPLATALICGRPRLAALALATSAIAAFLAHEPALLLLGRRGARARREESRRALWVLLGWLFLATCAATIGFWSSPRPVLLAAIPGALLFLASIALIAANRERTTAGEIGIATALVSAAMPVAVAAGWSIQNATAAAIAWSVGLGAATVAVRGILAAKKRNTPPSRTAALVAIAPIFAGLLAAAGLLPLWAFAATVPLVALAVVIALRPPQPRALHAVGWTLVAATVATGAVIALGVLA